MGLLEKKISIKILLSTTVLALAGFSIIAYNLRDISLEAARTQAYVAVEIGKASLMEQMGNGHVSSRSKWLEKFGNIANIQGLRLTRSSALIKEYGDTGGAGNKQLPSEPLIKSGFIGIVLREGCIWHC